MKAVALDKPNPTLSGGFRNTIASWLFFITPFLTFLAVFHEVFLFRSTFSHDALFWYPNFHFFLNCLVQGVLPLWDPYSYGGSPFYLNHTLVGALDPLTLLFVPLVKFGGWDIFSAYQANYLARFFIFYAGLHLFVCSFVRNRWAASAACAWGLFTLGTCAFRQNGYFVMMTYVPFFLWATSTFFRANLKKKQAQTLVWIAVIAAGLTFNLYLPLYFLLVAALFIFLAVFQYGIRSSLRKLAAVGPYVWIATALCFICLAAPTLIILYDCSFPLKSHVISLTRSEQLLESGRSLISAHQMATPEWRGSGSAADLWVALLSSISSPYFIFPGSRFFTEHFFTFPILLTFCLFQRKLAALLAKRSPSVFFPFLATVILVFFRYPVFEAWIGYVPIAREIRQFGNFFGYFVLFGSVVYAQALAWLLTSGGPAAGLKPKDLIPFLLFMLGLLGSFLCFLDFLPKSLARGFGETLPGTIASFSLSCLLIYFYLKTHASRFVLYALLWGAFTTIVFSMSLKDHVTNPTGALGKTILDHPRTFTFVPQRFPCLPRPHHFTGFTSAMYLLPTLFYHYPNNYGFVPRKTMEALRFLSVDTLRAIHAFGVPILAQRHTKEITPSLPGALKALAKRPPVQTKDSLLLVEESSSAAEMPESQKIDPLPRAFYRPWDFYPKRERMNFQEMARKDEAGSLRFSFDRLTSQIIFASHGDAVGTPFYDPFFYGPGFFARAAYIESSVIFDERGGRFFFGFDFSGTPELHLTETALPSSFRNSYEDKWRGFNMEKVTFVVCQLEEPPPTREPFTIETYTPNEVRITFENRQPSWIYFADSDFPGWRAFLGQEPVKIFNANFCFKAVPVHNLGRVSLTFLFEPQPYTSVFRLFILLSLPAMAGFWVLLILFLCGNPERHWSKKDSHS